MKKRTNKTIIIYLIIIWIISAFLFESTDLWLSIRLFNPNSEWAKYLELFGEIPGLLIVFMGAHIFAATLKSSSNLKKILFTSLLLTTSSFITIYVFYGIAASLPDGINFFNSNRAYFYFAAIMFNIIVSYLFKKQAKFSKSYILFSRVSVKLFFYGYLIFIALVKILWGRVRFRDLNGHYEKFTVWYLPQGITGNDSFPSGHAAMAWMLLPLFILVTNEPLRKRIVVKGFIISWAITLCVSRIVIGAHYVSDVLFASFIMIISYLLILKHETKNIK